MEVVGEAQKYQHHRSAAQALVAQVGCNGDLYVLIQIHLSIYTPYRSSISYTVIRDRSKSCKTCSLIKVILLNGQSMSGSLLLMGFPQKRLSSGGS